MEASIALHKVAYHAKILYPADIRLLHKREALYAQESNTVGCDELTKQYSTNQVDYLTDFY